MHVRIFSRAVRGRKSIGGLISPINRRLRTGTVRQSGGRAMSSVLGDDEGARGGGAWPRELERGSACPLNVARHAVKNVFCN